MPCLSPIPSSRPATRWLVAGFVISALALLLWIQIGRLASDTEVVQLPPTDQLVEKFGTVIFENDGPSEQGSEIVSKWNKELRIVLVGDEFSKYRIFLDDHLRMISTLTGLEVNIFQDTSEGGINIFAFIGNRDTMIKYLDRFSKEEDIMGSTNGKICFALFRYKKDGIILAAGVFISNDYGEALVQQCILEEFTQILGMAADSELVRPSVFSRDDIDLTAITLTDRILVRTLYDDRIVPGASRVDTLAVAKEVIGGLVDAVRTGGTEALEKPR